MISSTNKSHKQSVIYKFTLSLIPKIGIEGKFGGGGVHSGIPAHQFYYITSNFKKIKHLYALPFHSVSMFSIPYSKSIYAIHVHTQHFIYAEISPFDYNLAHLIFRHLHFEYLNTFDVFPKSCLRSIIQ